MEQVTVVVNYDIPVDVNRRPDCETYLHRSVSILVEFRPLNVHCYSPELAALVDLGVMV